MRLPAEPSDQLHPTVAARVLLVDDDAQTLRALSAQLKGDGNIIRTATNAQDALATARSWRPDLILLDVMMPGVDGFEICRRLRADPELTETRVYFLTALDDREARLEGFEAGADDFLTKPLDRTETLVRIAALAKVNRYRSLLRQHREVTALDANNALPQSIAPGLTDEKLADAFERAIRGLRLFVQPIVMIGAERHDRIFAQEALMRTQSGDTLHDPLVVLAAAARLERRMEVGQAVRALAADLIERLPTSQLLFMNTSARELQDESFYAPDMPLVKNAHRVVLELTEREPLEELDNVRARVAQLRAYGFRFAIDDLGAGYSSLNTLAVIEPEFVKLDRALVQGAYHDSTRGKIVSSIVALCEDLGVQLIAEGVETLAEQHSLEELGCRLQQGYFFARPSPLGGETQ